VRQWSSEDTKKIADEVLSLSDPKAISELLKSVQKKEKKDN